MKTLTQAVTLLLALSSAALAADEPVTKEVTGEAAIVEGNKLRAKEVAIDAAKRTAVEQVAGTFVSATTLTQNSQLINDQILSHSAGYISSWSQVGKEVEEAGVLRVTIKATVSTAKLDQDLVAVQALITKLGNRKLVILTQEQAVDTKGTVLSGGVMATVLTEAFKQDGWTIIDPSFAAGKLHLAAGASMGQVEAKEIGELSKADYILYGTVSYRYQPPDSMLKDAQVFLVSGEYDLALFATDSGSQLAKESGKLVSDVAKNGNKISPLISYERTAHDVSRIEGAKVVADVRAKTLEYLRSAEQNGNRVVMNVTGLSDYSHVQGFKKVLSDSVTGVRKVNPGSFGNGKAQFDVTFVGSTDDFAERIGGKTYRGKKINVTGVSGNTIEVTLAK